MLANNSCSSGLSTTRSRSQGDISTTTTTASTHKIQRNSFIPILRSRRSSRSNIGVEVINHTPVAPPESLDKEKFTRHGTKKKDYSKSILDGVASSSSTTTTEEASTSKNSNSKHKQKTTKVSKPLLFSLK